MTTRSTPCALRTTTLALSLLLLGCGHARTLRAQDAAPPRVFSIRGEEILKSRERLRAGDETLRPALERLLRQARAELQRLPVVVTEKKRLPPSGDVHDYFSLSPYWWPDPASPDGLPYLRRDGETNPESKRDLDQPRVHRLGSRLQTLALAYYFTGDEAFAEAAARQLRAWFIDPATRMNPHLRYAQLRMGIPKIRGTGLIDTRWFLEAADAAGLIQGSPHWTEEDQRALRDWFAQYQEWYLTSEHGRLEVKSANNHGSWYAAQAAGFALFLGDTATARGIVEGIKARIAAQIRPDGSQPLENARTRSLHYSNFNIEALSRLAEMGRHVGVDLWGYQAPEGGSLRRATDRIAPFVADQEAWPDTQLDPVEHELLLMSLRRARTAFGDTLYAEAIRSLPAELVRTDRSLLLYPDGR